MDVQHGYLPPPDEPEGILGRWAFEFDRAYTTEEPGFEALMDAIESGHIDPAEETELESNIIGAISSWITDYEPIPSDILETMHLLATQGKYQRFFQMPHDLVYRGDLYDLREIADWLDGQRVTKGQHNVSVTLRPGRSGLGSSWSKSFGVAKNFARKKGRGRGRRDPNLVPVIFIANPARSKFIDLAPFTDYVSGHGGYAEGEEEVMGIGPLVVDEIIVL